MVTINHRSQNKTNHIMIISTLHNVYSLSVLIEYWNGCHLSTLPWGLWMLSLLEGLCCSHAQLRTFLPWCQTKETHNSWYKMEELLKVNIDISKNKLARIQSRMVPYFRRKQEQPTWSPSNFTCLPLHL